MRQEDLQGLVGCSCRCFLGPAQKFGSAFNERGNR
ncbi:hypothetical protein V6Z11_D08G126100 [Gossypium hirsutum]